MHGSPNLTVATLICVCSQGSFRQGPWRHMGQITGQTGWGEGQKGQQQGWGGHLLIRQQENPSYREIVQSSFDIYCEENKGLIFIGIFLQSRGLVSWDHYENLRFVFYALHNA